MFFLRRKRYNKNKLKPETAHEIPNKTEPVSTYQISRQKNRFAAHISKYIGQTVTIFVASGGISGAGFTGVLLYADDVYIKLITSIGPAPACSLGNACILSSWYNFFIGQSFYSYNNFIPHAGFVKSLGSFTIIPVDKITSFVHNGV